MKRNRKKASKDVVLEEFLLDFIPEKGIIGIITSYFVYARWTVFVSDGPVDKQGRGFAFVRGVRWGPSLSKKNPGIVVKYQLMSLPSISTILYGDFFRQTVQKKPNMALLEKMQKAKGKKSCNALHHGKTESMTENIDGCLNKGDCLWLPYNPDEQVLDISNVPYVDPQTFEVFRG